MHNNQVYVYPDRSYSLKPDTNPYIQDLVTALENTGTKVVRSKTAWLGVIDMFFYIRSLDAVVFNWVEEVANRTMGYVQVIALIILIPILKFHGVKIIWTVHNRVSHSPRNRAISNYFRKLLSQKADVIITHSKESIEAFNASPVIYYPHPFKVNYVQKRAGGEYTYDLLFWGTILPYKGIKEFLEYVHKVKCTDLRICIQGKCPDQEYLLALKKLETNSIFINNIFTSDEDLNYLFEKSRVIAFTYRSESVLSSGALIESLAKHKTVIGPNFGNFRDCQQEGIIYTYSNFDELIQTVRDIGNNHMPHINTNKIDQYIQNYSWDSYARFLKTHFDYDSKLELAQVA